MTASAVTPRAPGARVLELESLRGLAALLIVIFHIPKWNPILNVGFINHSFVMVDVFFVLSGFVIHESYGDRLHTLRDVGRFQFLRLGRLYTLHLLLLTGFLLVELLKLLAQVRWGVASPNTMPFRENSLEALAQQVFLVQAIGPTGHSKTYNGAAWSISVEFYTYLVFAWLVLRTGQRRPLVFAAMAALSILALATREHHGFNELLRCWAGFFTGCLTSLALRDRPLRVPAPVPFVLLGLLLVFLQARGGPGLNTLIYPLTALLVVCLVSPQDHALKHVLRARPLVWLGTVSYSIYMAHPLIIWVANQAVRRLSGLPEAMLHRSSTPQMGAAPTLVASLAFVAATLLVSAVLYRWVEAPMREASRRFAATRL